MKRSLCGRSMMLGAVIMFIGLAVGAIVSPPLTAQRNAVFGEIVCTGLTVVNEEGKQVIELGSSTTDKGVVEVRDQNGKKGIRLIAGEQGSSVIVAAPGGGDWAVSLSSQKTTSSILMSWRGQAAVHLGAGVADGNGVAIFDKAGKTAIRLQADEEGNDLQILNKGEILGIGLGTHAKGNGVTVFDKAGNRAIVLDGDEEFNTVTVYDKAGKQAIGFYGFPGGVMQTKLKP